MRKIIFSSLIVSSVTLVTPIRADEPPAPAQQEQVVVESADEDVLPAGKAVGKREPDSRKEAKKRRWQNIGLAVGAIAVAVTAIILASSNNGHKK